MNPTGPQISEQLAWEGIIGAYTALWLWIVLAVVAGWFLWRERYAVGPRWAVVFWLLRVTAFGCALWMLAGPTQLRIERTTTPQSIAVFADGSESMDVVDPPEPANSLRWTLAINEPGDDSAVTKCDRLVVVLGAAQADCERLVLMIKEHRPVKQLKALAASLTTLLARAEEHASATAAALGGDDDSAADRARRIETLLDEPAAEALSMVEASLTASDRASGDEVVARVEQLSESIASARRRAVVLASDLAQQFGDESSEDQVAMNRLPRREKVGRALDAMERTLDNQLADSVRIRRFRFDHMPTAVESRGGWTDALASPPVPIVTATAVASNPDGTPGENAADTSSTTNISAVLEQLASERADHATRLALVLTDGRHNSPNVPVPQEVATQLAGMAIYLVPIGNAIQLRDVLLHRVEAPSAVTEKDSALIDVIVTGFDCDGETSAVVLRHEGREIDRQDITFSGQRGDQRARFKVPAEKLGWQEFVVEVEPVDDEANTANNFVPVSFEVVRDRTRVLLADGVARWEYRYLNQLFRREERVDFDELLFFPRVHGSGRMADRPEFPQDLEGWSRYDVVILGDVGPRQLSTKSQQALDEFVRKRGGNLIVVAGSNSMPAEFAHQPLIDLLPVEQDANVYARQGYNLRVTDEGRFHSALLIADSPDESIREWQSVYDRFPVFGLSDYSRPKSTARTLVEAVSDSSAEVSADANDPNAAHAFLSWQRVGAGRVAYLAAPESYRLRWRRGDRMHHRFWGQLLRWITAANAGAGTDLVRMQTDRTNYLAGEPVEMTAWLKDANGRPLAGESIDAVARTFRDEELSIALVPDDEVPGRYFGSLDGLAAGAYQISLRGSVVDRLMPAGSGSEPVLSTVTVRSSDSVELLNTQCNRALLEQVAKITGGQVIPPTAIDEVFQLVSFTPEVSERIERTPLWNRWTNLLLVLGCAFTEWIVRKSKGLV